MLDAAGEEHLHTVEHMLPSVLIHGCISVENKITMKCLGETEDKPNVFTAKCQ